MGEVPAVLRRACTPVDETTQAGVGKEGMRIRVDRGAALLVVASLAAVCAAAGGGAAAVAAEAASPSAIGDALPVSIAVSPAYARTGLVVVSASRAGGCSSNCGQLWLSHDRGDSWTRVDRSGFSGAHLGVAVDGGGHEILFASTSSGVERSEDLGATWTSVGGAGIPTVSPDFAHDLLVAVAGKPDYVVRGGGSQPASGSAGTMADADWAIPSGYSAPGRFAPVLLGGLSGSVPTVERCTTAFACSAPAPLPAPDSFAGPANLATSSAYAQDGGVFAQTADGVYKSTDGGASFTPMVLPTAGATHVGIGMLATSPTYAEGGPDRHVYVALMVVHGTGKSMTVSGGIDASSDGGATWSPLGPTSPLDHGAMSVAAAPDGRVFAGYFGPSGAGLLCNPEGRSWRAGCSAVQPAAAATGAGTALPGSRPCTGTACAGSTAAPSTNALPDTGGAQQPDRAAGSDPRRLAIRPAAAAGGSGGWRVAAVVALAVVLAGAIGAAVFLRRRRGHGAA